MKTLNMKLEKIIDILNGQIFGKIFLHLLSSFVAGVILAGCLYFGRSLYDYNNIITREENDLYNLYISMSDEYVQSCFGIPCISFKEQEQFVDNYYVIHDAVVRTVSKDGFVVGFFITSTNKRNVFRIKLNTLIPTGKGLGNLHFQDISEGHLYKIDSTPFPTSNFRLKYYSEKYMTGRWANYNCYVFGVATYGFEDNNNAEILVKNSYFDGETVFSYNGETFFSEELDEMRIKAIPNTYGVIKSGYEDVLSIIPMEDGGFTPYWENVYTILKDLPE